MLTKQNKTRILLYCSFIGLGIIGPHTTYAVTTSSSEKGSTESQTVKEDKKPTQRTVETGKSKPLPQIPSRKSKQLPPPPAQRKGEGEKANELQKSAKWQENLTKREKGEGITAGHLEAKFAGFQKLIDGISRLNKYNNPKEQKKYSDNLEVVRDMFRKYKEKTQKADFKFDPVEWSAIIGGLTAQSLSLINKLIDDLDLKIQKTKKVQGNTPFMSEYAKLLTMQKLIKEAFQIKNIPVENRSALTDEFEKQYIAVSNLIK